MEKIKILELEAEKNNKFNEKKNLIKCVSIIQLKL